MKATLHHPEILDRLQAVRTTGDGQWEARCPAHEDRRASLSVGVGTDGTTLVKCHAGCSAADVTAAVGLTLADLFPATQRNGQHNGKANGFNVVKAYDYQDESGTLLFQVCRLDPKDFRQRRPDGRGGFEWTTKGTRKVLYRLPELLTADPLQPVFIVEGEKDADRLRAMGLVATCNPGGAGKWKSEYAESLRGRHVVILPDNDKTGREHAEHVARSLRGVAASIKVCVLPGVPDKGDVSDWLDVDPASACALDVLTLADETPEWEPPAGEPEHVSDEPPEFHEPDEREPIPQPVSLGTLCRNHPEQKPPLIHGILREGEVGCINAKAKIGKSWALYGMMLSIASGRKWLDRFECAKGRVLLIDFELHPETLAKRIPTVARAMGIPEDVYRNSIDVMSMRGRLRHIHELMPLFAGIEPGRYKLIALDALYRVLPPGVSENDNAAMADVFNRCDQYVKMTKAAIQTVHHQTKGDQSGKDVVDVGSGASSFARAVDAHLVMRRHEEENHVVLDAAIRSWEPIEPLTLRWEYPLWHPAEDVDPADLKGRKTRGEESQAAKDAEADAAVLDAADDWKNHRELRRLTGMGTGRLDRCIVRLRARGHLEHQEQDVNGGKADCYRRSWRAPASNTEGQHGDE